MSKYSFPGIGYHSGLNFLLNSSLFTKVVIAFLVIVMIFGLYQLVNAILKK